MRRLDWCGVGIVCLLAVVLPVGAMPVLLGDPIPIGSGENVMACANFNHDRGGSSDLTLVVRLDVDGKTVIDEGQAVKYLVNGPGDEGPADWYEREFDDSKWDDGEQSVGYGDGDDWTVVPNGTASVFTRSRFDIANAGAVKKLTLYVDWDDFYLITINGVEVARDTGLNSQVGQPDIPPGNQQLNGGHGAAELPKDRPNKGRWGHANIDVIEITDFEIVSFDVAPKGKLPTTWARIKYAH